MHIYIIIYTYIHVYIVYLNQKLPRCKKSGKGQKFLPEKDVKSK